MKILLIAYHFPPLNSVASSRTYAFARYLAEFGHTVTVLTAEHKGDGCNFESATSSLSYQTVFAEKIHHVNRNSSLLGSSALASVPDRFANVKFRLKKLLSYRIIGNTVTTADRWFFKARRKAILLMTGERFDVIISSFSPISCHLIACGLKRKFPETCWVADYRDLWSLNDCVPRPLFPLSAVQKAVEGFLNRRADVITTVSEPLREAIQAAWSRKAHVVENGYFPGDERRTGELATGFTRKITFSYTGSIYWNKHDPSPFFLAVRQLIEEGTLEKQDVDIRFYGENSYLLKNRIRSCDVEDIVTLLPLVSREESLLIQKQSTGLLFLESDDPASRGVLTGKLFEYLVSGTPVIATGISTLHAAGKLIEATRTGYVCGDNVDAIKKAVVEIVSGRKVEPDTDQIAAYRRDSLVKKLERIIEENCRENTDHRQAG